MMFLGCFYLWRGRRVGPVSTDEITRLVRAGMLRHTDDVLQAWKDGDEVFFFRTEAQAAGAVEVPMFA
jgi:hypothetical protein